MNVKYLILLLLLFAFKSNAFSQIDSEATFNQLSFCGINSSLVINDVSTGGVVTIRNWTVDGPAGFIQYTGSNPSETVALTEVGLYTVRLTVCSSTPGDCNTHFYTNFVEVKEKPTLSLNPSTYCVGTPNIYEVMTLPITLQIDSFYWNFGEGAGQYEGDSIENYSFNSIGPKTIRIEVEANNGCRDTITQNVNAFDKPTAIITVSDSQICLGGTANFDALSSMSNTPGISYAWDTDFNTGIDNNNSSFISFANADLQVMLEVTDDNGCVDSAFQNLTVIQRPDVNFSIAPQCANQVFNLDAIIISDGGSPIDSVYWYIDSTIYQVGSSISYTHPNKDSIPVILFAINEEGCPDGLLQYISIDTLPFIDIIQNDTIICIGDSIELESLGVANFLWLPDSLSGSQVIVSPDESTLYTLIGLSGNGACPNSEDEILVEVLTEPEYTIDLSSTTPGLGTPISIDFSYDPLFSNNDSVQWLDSGTRNVLENEYGNENNFVAVEDVSFPVLIQYNKDETQCVFETTVDIKVNENCTTDNFYVPNAFSPNDDTRNDNFIVKGYSIDRILNFIVFDRSGKEMYSRENIEFSNGVADTGWNGKSKNNKICNSGVYVYYYKTLCINGLETEGSGNITLFR